MVSELIAHFVATTLALLIALTAIIDSVRTISRRTFPRTWTRSVGSRTLPWPLASFSLPRVGALARLRVIQERSRSSARGCTSGGTRCGASG